MDLPKPSLKSITDGLKSIGKLRIKVSHGTMLTYSALVLILFIAFTIRALPLRWEIQTGSVHLSEFDPYYQFSLTNFMINNGLFSPYLPQANGDPHWIDYQRWYPGGIDMGLSLSSLPMTAALFYDIFRAMGIIMDPMTFCALVPVFMGTLAVLIIYFLGKDIGGKTVGLFAALFLALSSAFIQRTALGFFDTETVGMLSLVLFSLLFLRAIENERPMSSSIKYSLGSAAALAFFVTGWGAAYYLIGLTALFVFVLILLKRYSRKLLLTYSITFGIGLWVSMNNPYISLNYLTSYAILPVAGVFVLLVLNEIVHNLTSAKEKLLFVVLFLVALIASFTAIFALGYSESIAGKFLTVLDPFLRSTNPLVESVAEHRISAWGSMYYDLGIGILFCVVGLFFVSRNLSNRNLFLLIFGLTAVYFGASMVRLLALMAPAFGLLAAVGIVGLIRPFYALLREQPKAISKKFRLEHVGREYAGVAVFLIFLLLMTNFAIAPQSGGTPKVLRQAYQPVTITAGSLPIAPNTPVNEWLNALQWLKDQGNSSIVVAAWWDYGYWLSLLGNVTSLADNATINSTQIENIGFAMMANETQSVKMLRQYNAKYLLVFTTAKTSDGSSYGFGDEGKWMWMAKISGEAKNRFISEGWLDEQTAWDNETNFGNYTSGAWVYNEAGNHTTIYKLMAYAKNQWIIDNTDLSDPDFAPELTPTYFAPAFIAGKTLSVNDANANYGGVVPLVAIYEIDYSALDTGS